LRKTYDFFEGVPENFRSFLEKSLNLPDFKNGTKIITSQKLLDHRGHVTEGRLGDRNIVLKRSQSPSEEQNDRKPFYAFMDAVKEKLNELAGIEKGDTLSDEEKKSYLKPLLGLGNIVPIVAIAKVHRFDQQMNETIEILPQIMGHTLRECVERNFPPYDTPLGLPRNQDIAFDLLLQLTSACLALHTCGYTHNDIGPKNIIISDHGSLTALKLIDWENLKKIEEFSDIARDIHRLSITFSFVLLGEQFQNSFRKALRKAYKNNNRLPLKNLYEKYLRFLKKTKLYSKKTSISLAKLLTDMLSPKEENHLDLETVMIRLEALSIDGEEHNRTKTEFNETNAIGEDKNELDEG
jgi:tRNA A-37 threonylcarbamoyl transferase component Bud32